MSTRREFLKAGVAGLGMTLAGSFVLAAPAESLLDTVRAICRRLGPAGWRDMLLDVTGGELDILAPDLQSELAKPISEIDRNFPGFGDFALMGRRAIDPGQPDTSLLYHALAAPSVQTGRNGRSLETFATLAELDAIESYIYATKQVSLDTLRAQAGSAQLSIVMFATQYRNVPMSVNGRHAQLCFSRAGIGRIGNLGPRYDARLRSFVGNDEAKVFDFHVVPRRFAPYLAISTRIDPRAPGRFGPQDPQPGDNNRQFWVPVHKLFSGPECLTGMNLRIAFSRGMLNDELASFHRFLDDQHLDNNWSGDDLKQFPFEIRDDRIASLSTEREFGPGVLVPRANKLIEEAHYRDARLTFPVDHRYSGNVSNLQMSSLFVLPNAEPPLAPAYLDDAEQGVARPAPEYINIRHRVVDEKVENLNDKPDLMAILEKGNYFAQHYIDFSGDGWVAASCPELLKTGVSVSVPSFCMVGLPDFLPKVAQRDLMLWWHNEMPGPLREALWATPPFALSQTRIAPNIELTVGFNISDDTVSAIVSQPGDEDSGASSAAPQVANGTLRFDKIGMPDGSPGLFDPGWDSSQGVYGHPGKGDAVQRYLVSHGLGSPFIEDAKLCAALGSYWPGVAPDATRQYQPDKTLSGISYPWPTAVPFTDEEIGMVAVSEGPLKGHVLPWDGVPGPRRKTFQGKPVIEYEDEKRVDYIDIQGTMTAALTSRIDLHEYQNRTLSMAAVYWSLGIRVDPATHPSTRGMSSPVNAALRDKASWAVLSFRPVNPKDAAFAQVAAQTGATVDPTRRYYRFELYRWGKQFGDPARLRSIFSEILEEATAYSDGRQVILKRGDAWKLDTTIPT